MNNNSNTLIQILAQQLIMNPSLNTVPKQFEDCDSSCPTQRKLSYQNTCGSQSIDFNSGEMEQEENPSANSLDMAMKTENNLSKENNQIAIFTSKKHISNSQQLKLLTTPKLQYTFQLGGEMYIDLRWVMQDKEDEILNSQHFLSIKDCPQTYTFKKNKMLFIECEERTQQLLQFKFLTQMLYSLGTAQAFQLGRLIDQYQEYVNEKKEQLLLKKEQISKIDMKARQQESMKQAKTILAELNPNEFACSYTVFGDEVDIFHQKAQCFTPSMLEILGVTQEEMSKIALSKGLASFFDWKTTLNMTFGRLMSIQRENSQRNWSMLEGDIITFDGFRIKSSIQIQYYPLNEHLFPYVNEKTPNLQKLLLVDSLVIMKFSFHPMILKQLLNYRQTQTSRDNKSNILEEELQQSVLSSIFLEKYYEKELESLGQKKKKIRKTKAKAIEEMMYFSKQQKNKYVLSHS